MSVLEFAQPGRAPASARGGAPDLLTRLVAAVTDVPASAIAGGPRGDGRVSAARQLAMYLAYTVLQWPLAEVGAAFGRDRTTAGHACARVEDRRDDPAFDALLDRLEGAVRALLAESADAGRGA